ncbi:hypothetical protein E5843_02595 [Luteimonas yindakuii]|uniref:hypothetical protein n=1 Tax=Luteimonas yindakuii TaxID=2565782 RepID=UPI0010A52EEF|nr:hypothetical protein [Luteimonas yindakuii]QCO66946.1 hypothetical protein E5843_02595 [Luteimonas yindakuii]
MNVVTAIPPALRGTLLLVLGAWMPVALAQSAPPAPKASAERVEAADAVEPVEAGPATGDAWIDGQLVDIDRYAQRHRPAFVDELVRYHGAPRKLAEEVLAREDHWSAGELYFACALGQVAGRPCRTVITLRDRAPTQPWSEIAGQVGAAPRSAPYRRLRTAIADSYRRWGRPLPGGE